MEGDGEGEEVVTDKDNVIPAPLKSSKRTQAELDTLTEQFNERRAKEKKEKKKKREDKKNSGTGSGTTTVKKEGKKKTPVIKKKAEKIDGGAEVSDDSDEVSGEEDTEEEEEGFKVESILATTKVGKFRYWLVKWGGYDDASWEPNTNVSSVQADKMIKAYKTEHTQWQEEEHSDAKNQCLKTEPWTDKIERNLNIYSL